MTSGQHDRRTNMTWQNKWPWQLAARDQMCLSFVEEARDLFSCHQTFKKNTYKKKYACNGFTCKKSCE